MTSKSTGARRERSFAVIDEMPETLRGCVHEYGFAIVACLTKYGIRQPSHIHDIVREIWSGARQPAQHTIGAASNTPIHDQIDWTLIQAGAGISAKTLVRVLWSNNMVIVPREAGKTMVDASMATVAGHDIVCTKAEKHRRRLNAALTAQVRRLWPHLFSDGLRGAAREIDGKR